jgi:hypothetical protein
MKKEIQLGELARIREKINSKFITADDLLKKEYAIKQVILEWSDEQQGWHYNWNDTEANTYGWKTVLVGDMRLVELFTYYIDEKRNYLGEKIKITHLEIRNEWKVFRKWLKLCNTNGFEFTNKYDNWKLNL